MSNPRQFCPVSFARSLLFLWPIFALAGLVPAATLTVGPLTADVEPSGEYRVVAASSRWTLAGSLPGAAEDIKIAAGSDRVGAYQQLAFAWKDSGRGVTGFIRLYERAGLALFSDTLPQASISPAAPFPDFTKVPAGWFHFSYQDRAFSAPQFHFGTTSSPWMFFDAQDHALLVSAADNFLVANLTGNGIDRVAAGFSPTLTSLPGGFTQQTLLAFGDGINATYDLWGQALTDLQGKHRPANDADDSLKYFGYWTDNGADYYYNYDQNEGYAGTLEALVAKYREEKIPLRYLQLDSWWYHKTYTFHDGKVGEPKNPKLPEGDWNCYGGLLDYTASQFLFPQGLASFQQKLGLPLITHNRWIDPASPYHAHFKISGLAAVDPEFWDRIAAYLKESGIVTYEQDWLVSIFEHSPELSSTPDLGNAFLDNMARATRKQGQTMQYCMATPRCFLQGSKYDNLTTIRTSDDRFCPERYHDFLYTSRFATALGMWPWADVFMSGETNNLLLSNLSAGPVGTGDALGKENAANILKTVRADGVIIKPDAALLPVDSAYLAEAQKQPAPLVATTYTDLGGQRVVYAVVIDPPKTTGASYTLSSADLGTAGNVYVYDYFAGEGQFLEKGKSYVGKVPAGSVAYLVAAPVGASGVTFLGDRDKFVSLGRQRVAALDDRPDGLKAKLLLARGEDSVTLHGYCRQRPVVTVQNGIADTVEYDAASGHFTVAVRPDASVLFSTDSDPVRALEVSFQPSQG